MGCPCELLGLKAGAETLVAPRASVVNESVTSMPEPRDAAGARKPVQRDIGLPGVVLNILGEGGLLAVAGHQVPLHDIVQLERLGVELNLQRSGKKIRGVGHHQVYAKRLPHDLIYLRGHKINRGAGGRSGRGSRRQRRCWGRRRGGWRRVGLRSRRGRRGGRRGRCRSGYQRSAGRGRRGRLRRLVAVGWRIRSIVELHHRGIAHGDGAQLLFGVIGPPHDVRDERDQEFLRALGDRLAAE